MKVVSAMFLLFQTDFLITRIILFLSFGSVAVSGAVSSCHACFKACSNVTECDCTSSAENSCRGEYCYVKVDRLNENGLGTITKGCANVAPAEYVDVCQYVNDKTSAECYCQGDLCNNIDKFNRYQIDPLPLVSCCQCNGYDFDNETTDCMARTCFRNCTGNYCFNDIVRQSQGCGWGYSMAWQFVRNSHRTDLKETYNTSYPSAPAWFWKPGYGDMTCTEAYADIGAVLRGCTCVYDFCNQQERANYEVTNITEARHTNEQYCYAVHNVSFQPITLDAFRASTTCPGHYCFITMTTVSVVYNPETDNSSLLHNSSLFHPISNFTNIIETDDETWPKLQPRYELTAGCLLIDDQSKVETGCTVQWSESEDKPTTKHCVCTGHNCNFFDLITGEDRRKSLAFDWRTSKDYRTISSATAAHSSAFLLSALVIAVISIR